MALDLEGFYLPLVPPIAALPDDLALKVDPQGRSDGALPADRGILSDHPRSVGLTFGLTPALIMWPSPDGIGMPRWVCDGPQRRAVT